MKISIVDQEVNDFDWFLLGKNNCILHFTSGGGRLPDKVSESEQDLDFLKYFFYDLNKFDCDNNCLMLNSSFEEMARKGLYSYDRLNIHDPNDTKYQLIACPEVELKFEALPTEVQLTLARFKTDFDPTKDKIIDVGELIEA